MYKTVGRYIIARDRIRTTKSVRRRATAAVGAALLAGAIVGCGSASSTSNTSSSNAPQSQSAATGIPPVKLTPQTPAPTGSLATVTWDSPYGEPQSLDPVVDWNIQENMILANVCEALFRLNPNMQVEPALATSLTAIKPGVDLITLRQGVRFSDGSPMTAADVVYSIERHIKSPADAWVEYTSLIQSVKAKSPSQVVLTWKPNEPLSPAYAEALLYGGLGTIVEKRYAEEKGSSYGTSSGGVMCTGPFKLAKWTPGQQIALTPNPYYWDAALRPHVSQFVFKFVTDPATITSALQSGEIDGSYDLPFSAIPQLTSASTGTLYYGNSWEQDGVLVATTTGPTTSALVREALSLAVDRSGLARTAFYGKAAPSKWMFPPSAYGSAQSVFQKAYASLPDNSHPQIAAAKKLVAQAGMPKQQMAVAAESGSPESQDVATDLSAAASEIGLNMKIRVLSPAAFDNAVFTPGGRKGLDFLVGVGGTLFATFPFPGDLLLDYGLKTSTSNYAGIVNPNIQRDTVGALTTPDAATAAQQSLSGALLYTKESVFLPIVNVPSLLFMNKRITGAPTGFPVYLFYPWAAQVGSA
jgi:peptide/nickel transport system substrate-binding protein